MKTINTMNKLLYEVQPTGPSSRCFRWFPASWGSILGVSVTDAIGWVTNGVDWVTDGVSVRTASEESVSPAGDLRALDNYTKTEQSKPGQNQTPRIRYIP